MNVSMFMTRQLVTVGPQEPIAEVAALMAQKRIRRLLVVENKPEGPALLGIITAKDILHWFPPEVNPFAVITSNARQASLTSGKIMQRDLLTTTPETPIENAATVMRDKKIGALPVLREKHLVGIITESDVFRAFVGLLTSDDHGVRITFDVSTGEDVFGLVLRASQRHHLQVSSLIRAQQENQPVCVVRVVGAAVDSFLDEIWSSGHRVLNVIRFP